MHGLGVVAGASGSRLQVHFDSGQSKSYAGADIASHLALAPADAKAPPLSNSVTYSGGLSGAYLLTTTAGPTYLLLLSD